MIKSDVQLQLRDYFFNETYKELSYQKIYMQIDRQVYDEVNIRISNTLFNVKEGCYK